MSFVIFTSLFLSNFGVTSVQAQSACRISITPSPIELGDPVTVTVTSATFNGHAITPADGDFYLEAVPGNIGAGNLSFSNGSATMQIDNTSGLFPNDGQTYSLSMYHWNGFYGDSVACTSNQVFVNETDVNPQLGCNTPLVVPSTISLGQTNPLPTVIASGCPTQDVAYSIIISGPAGQSSIQPIYPEADGSINYPLNVFSEEGVYEVQLNNLSNFSSHVMSVTVTEALEEIIYTCGSEGLPSTIGNCAAGQTTNCCPADLDSPNYCPATDRPIFGTDPPRFNRVCACGEFAETCCSGSIPCTGSGLSCNENNRCDIAETGLNVYSCGETIHPDDIGPPANYRCNVCEVGRRAEDDLLWCACGGLGEPCCNFGSITDPDVVLPSDLSPCQEGFVCSAHRCVEPDVAIDTNPILCTDQRSIATALGCVRFDALTELAANIAGLMLGTSGGVALILIGYAALRIATSSGDPKVLQGSKELLWSAIGGILMVVLSVFLLRVIGVDILGLFG